MVAASAEFDPRPVADTWQRDLEQRWRLLGGRDFGPCADHSDGEHPDLALGVRHMVLRLGLSLHGLLRS